MKKYPLNRRAIAFLALVPVTLTGMFWAASQQSFSLQPSANIQEGNSSADPIAQQPVSPDEPAAATADERFSFDNAISRIEQIKAALSSFRQLTQISQEQIGASAIAPVGNTDWEIQNLGFKNWTGAVEGTLRKQEYQIKKLEFELAQAKFADGEITQSELAQTEAAYQQAEQDFQTFWNSFRIAD